MRVSGRKEREGRLKGRVGGGRSESLGGRVYRGRGAGVKTQDKVVMLLRSCS